MRKPRSNELFDLAPEPKTFVPVEGADHSDLIGALGLYEYKKLPRDRMALTLVERLCYNSLPSHSDKCEFHDVA